MKQKVIVISPAKKFSKNILSSDREISTMFIDKTKEIINSLDNLDKVFNTVSDKLLLEIKQYYQDWSKETYKAIDLYDGLFYKQLTLTPEDEEFINAHVLIIDALYGLIRPIDYISKYRLDFNTKLDINLHKHWKTSINDYLKDKEVYSLASKEFNDLLTVPFQVIETDKEIKQIKVARGKKLMEIIKARKIIL